MIEIAICDDDSKDLEDIVGLLQEIFIHYGIHCNLQSFTSTQEMLKTVKQMDIAILDISMEELNGIDLGRKLKACFPDAHIIYVTNYEQYCMQAINEIHAFSFLCKPLKKESMGKQVMELVREMEEKDAKVEKIFYKVTNTKGKEFAVLKLELKDILYFEYIKSKRRIAIVLKDEVYEFAYVMRTLVKELEEYGFAVSCRGNLVNLGHVMKIKGYNVYMDNGTMLALSQKRVVEFKEKINDFVCENV